MTMQETVEKIIIIYGGMDPRDAELLLPEEITALESEDSETEPNGTES